MPGLKPFLTYNLIDCLNVAEYNALNATQKHFFDVIVSAGTLDYAEGSQVRDFIQTIFPLGSTTRTNLIALLNKYISEPTEE